MESRAHALAAGLFVVLLIALLSLTAAWLGGPHFRGLPYDLITERSVAGLTPGASVRLRGVEVGRVDGIGFDRKTDGTFACGFKSMRVSHS
jgi:phospholipid/cholesterol/gamma-HCH transport system substrate-binding protein